MNEVIKIPANYISHLLAGECPHDIDYTAPGQWDNDCLLVKYEDFNTFYCSLTENEKSIFYSDNSGATCAICWYRFLKEVKNDTGRI